MGRLRRLARIAGKLALVAAAAFLLLEGSLRVLLFSDLSLARRLGARLRRAELYAPSSSTEYYKLRRLLGEDERDANCPDSELGWLAGRFCNPGLLHDDEPDLGDRRPVLLFGDSFAQCLRQYVCWEQLLEQSDLGDELAMLNYGVGGYGVDQIAALCKRVVPRFLARDPIVIVAILAEDDLDRAAMDFRGWPKPRWAVDEQGQLSRWDRELLPDSRAYVERYGVGIRSYAWNLLVWGVHVMPGRWFRRPFHQGLERELLPLNAALLADLTGFLQEAGVEHFVLVFHGPAAMRGGQRPQNREAFLLRQLVRSGTPYVLSRRPLAADMEATGRGLEDYFQLWGAGRNHYCDLGNEVAFRALRDGLEGRFHGPGERAASGR